jgi:hypothetical protein
VLTGHLDAVRSRFPGELAQDIGVPELPELIRRFLYERIHPNGPLAEDVALEACPELRGRVAVHHHAKAVFYAPSDPSGTGGMHCEMLRSNPAWRGSYARYDTVLIRNGHDADGMLGLLVGRVKLFCSFKYADVRYPCALVEWFVRTSDQPDPVTGMWIVEPYNIGRARALGLVHLDSVVRGCQLIGVYGDELLPVDFDFTYSLDSFRQFYVNRWIDYHSHEYIH